MTCVVCGDVRFGFDVDVPADFFSGLPKAGDAISAPAARQVIKTNPFVFMILSSLYFNFTERCPKYSRAADRNAPAELRAWASRDVLLIRSRKSVRTRGEPAGKTSNDLQFAA